MRLQPRRIEHSDRLGPSLAVDADEIGRGGQRRIEIGAGSQPAAVISAADL